VANDVKSNGDAEIDQDENKSLKYLSFRVSAQKFKEVKVAAIMKEMSLGEYLISLHDDAKESLGK